MVVGARSAMFAAVPDLGVIVIDEEHDASYKHEADPRYDARRVAAKRARLEDALVVFGSATPRPESWQGIARRVALPGRVGGELPRVRGGRPAPRRRLPAQPTAAGRAGPDRGRRRAGDPAAEPARRRRRDPLPDLRRVVPLPALRRLALACTAAAGCVCHHCGHSEHLPRACPACGSVDLTRIGAGTERVEEELRRALPGPAGAASGRRHRGPRRRARGDARTRSARPSGAVLIGTQLVAKGHDVPGVTVAAVLDAETGLLMPDFRAEERTFALLTQLAGRPGTARRPARPGDRPGLGSRVRGRCSWRRGMPSPEFLDGELERRRELGYPPFLRLVRVLVTGPDDERRQASPATLVDAARPVLEGDTILGPAPLFRIRDRARSHVLIKTPVPARAATVLRGLLRDLATDLGRASATAVVDVDPDRRLIHLLRR